MYQLGNKVLDFFRKNIILYAIIFFSLLFLFNNLHVYFHFSPQGIHLARQCDSYAFGIHYHNKHSGLFSPGNLNLESVDAKCAGEFPILYYFLGALYNIAGINLAINKIISLFFLAIGFYFTLKLVYKLSGSLLIATCLTLIFFSSTVLLYYSTLPLPEIISFGCCLLAYSYYFKANEVKSYLFIIYLSLTFSALFKASFLIHESVIFLMMVVKYRTDRPNLKRNLVAFLCSFILIALWYLYANHYNTINLDYYYTVKTKPIWSADCSSIFSTIDAVFNYWYSKYYFFSVFHFYFIVVAVYLVAVRKKLMQHRLIVLLLLLVSLGYILLFFTQFRDHDYYFIVLIPSIILIVSVATTQLVARFDSIYFRGLLITVMLILAYSALDYSRINLYRRYNNSNFTGKLSLQLNSICKFLDESGVNSQSKVLVVGDNSRNTSLVFMRRFGWTFENFKKDPAKLQATLDKADYLLVISPSENQIPDRVKIRLEEKKLNFRSNHIYKIIKTPAYR